MLRLGEGNLPQPFYWPFMITAHIYTLSDPTTGEVRYVGKALDPDGRFYRHLYYSDSEKYPKARWVRKLLRSGLKPLMKVIETVPESEWPTSEARWISHYRTMGARLLNIGPGGEGWAVGQKHSKKSRKKMSVSAKARMTSEWQSRMTISKVGHLVSETTRKKLSVKFKGRKLSHETPRAISKRQKALWASRSKKERAVFMEAAHTATRGVKNPGSSSKYWGVFLNKPRNKWQVQFRYNARVFYVGIYFTEIEAAKAYDQRVKTLKIPIPLNFK